MLGAAILTPDLWIEPLGALVKTGPAIVLMLVALLTLDNQMTAQARDNQWPDDDVILYDGVCIFCSRWVRFVATRDVERSIPLHRDPVAATARGWRRLLASIPMIPTPTPSSMAAWRISNPMPR